MMDLASWFHGRRGRIGLAAALVGAAMFLAGGDSIPCAEAKTARADLTLGPGGAGSGAQGRIQLKQQRRGERLKLRLENLAPRTDYEVRNGSTEDVIATLRTDRRGRAKKTLRAGSGARLSGALLEICEPGSSDPILEGQVPGDDSGMPRFDGTFSVGTVSTDPEAPVQVSVTLSSTTVRSPWGTRPDGEPTDGEPTDGEPTDGEAGEGTYDSISLFAGPGGVWIAENGMDGGIPELPSIPGPVTFWIADREGTLVKVATIEKSDGGMPIPLPGIDGGGNGDGTMPRAGMGSMGPGNHMGTGGFGFPDSGGDPGDGAWGGGMIFPQPDFYSWYADNTAEPGLPLGVASVSDLSGRAFEVRDGEDAVLLEGVLPDLEEVVFEPLPDPMPFPGFPCPGGDFNISIDIDLTGFDWGSLDFSSMDWGSFDFSKLLEGFKF